MAPPVAEERHVDGLAVVGDRVRHSVKEATVVLVESKT